MEIEDRLPISFVIEVYHALEDFQSSIVRNSDNVNNETALNCMLQCIVQQMYGLFGVKETAQYLKHQGVKLHINTTEDLINNIANN